MPNTTKKLMPMFKREVVSLIDFESKHRQEITDTQTMLMNRVMAKKMLEMGHEVSFLNARGKQGQTEKKEDIMKIPTEKYKKFADSLEEAIKYSRWKEKFFRYIYNNNLNKALEYDGKLQEWWANDNESLYEEVRNETGKTLVSLNYQTKGVEDTMGEQGYREHSDEMARFYKLRIYMLNQLRVARGINRLPIPQ